MPPVSSFHDGDPCAAPWRSNEFGRPEKRTAVILCLALGALGVHRFYLHQNALGLAYLLFCWTLIPLLVSLVDAFRFARMTETQFQSAFAGGVAHPSGP